MHRDRSKELGAQLSGSLESEAELEGAGVRDESSQLAGQHNLRQRVESSLHISLLNVQELGGLQLQGSQGRDGEAAVVATILRDVLEHDSRVVVAHPIGGELLDLGFGKGLDPALDARHAEEVGHDVEVDHGREREVARSRNGQTAGLDHLVELDKGDRG